MTESSYEIFDSAITQALKKYYGHPHYDDMYQECYLKILEVLTYNTYDPVYNLYGYAYVIARNTISTYRYHLNKTTTLCDGDLPDLITLPSGDESDYPAYIRDSAEYVISKYKSLLPNNFTVKDLYNLLSQEDPVSLVLTVVKGDFIWTIARV